MVKNSNSTTTLIFSEEENDIVKGTLVLDEVIGWHIHHHYCDTYSFDEVPKIVSHTE